MRSLFFRIFLSFLGATVLIGAVLLTLALTTDPRRSLFAPHEKRLSRLGQELAEAHRSGGGAALREIDRLRERRGEPPAYLFRDSEGPLSGAAAPAALRRLAARTAATEEKQAQRGPRGQLLALPLDDGYVLVAAVPRPSRLDRLLDPYGLTLRVGAVFLITGLVSYLLARSLSAPVRRLREATQGLAGGDLSARVGPSLGSRRDETAELGRDFDRMAERIGGLLASQRRLLGDISHELRSPLARLNVALGLARRKADPEVQGALDRIERDAERLNELIGQLLALTVLESGAETPEKVPTELGELVREVAEDADFEARDRGRAVRVIERGEVCVAVVPELLRRAVENVVRNAVRFTPERSEVEVRVARAEVDARPVARVSVRDHGPGVPPDALPHLFDPFYRVGSARERGGGGAGIGLAITERAVRLHGGSVRADNAEGGGLSVVIEIPLSRPEGGKGDAAW
jgi:signal transduction histidine kinase